MAGLPTDPSAWYSSGVTTAPTYTVADSAGADVGALGALGAVGAVAGEADLFYLGMDAIGDLIFGGAGGWGAGAPALVDAADVNSAIAEGATTNALATGVPGGATAVDQSAINALVDAGYTPEEAAAQVANSGIGSSLSSQGADAVSNAIAGSAPTGYDATTTAALDAGIPAGTPAVTDPFIPGAAAAATAAGGGAAAAAPAASGVLGTGLTASQAASLGSGILGAGATVYGAVTQQKASNAANAANQANVTQANNESWTNYLMSRGINPGGVVPYGTIPANAPAINTKLPLWATVSAPTGIGTGPAGSGGAALPASAGYAPRGATMTVPGPK